ncbi:hypothetical protein NDN08_005306 [Rhodosorus marinus]|uniref:Uncharacterized protein n=1 Tax=Rhodosorus marinus TaxID=101924 RepID=A0AAV8V1A0_9RHOD|nr:hypothetical protein NDN08_005306 [Rhodosorus marinus]
MSFFLLENDIPMILGLKDQARLGAVIDTDGAAMVLKKLGITLELEKRAGHLVYFPLAVEKPVKVDVEDAYIVLYSTDETRRLQ